MNVYDFDGTIFPGDCTRGFFFWYTNRHPKLWLTYFPKALSIAALRVLNILPEYQAQRYYYSYLNLIDDFDEQIEQYWDENEHKIAPWYLAQKRPDDLIISASPSCIIAPIASRLGVKYIASEFDREFGVFVDNMMYAKEKARYIIDQGFPVIENFYSDSLSDTPLALCAEKAHLVSNRASTVSDWPELDRATMDTVKKKIDTGWNVHLKENISERRLKKIKEEIRRKADQTQEREQ